MGGFSWWRCVAGVVSVALPACGGNSGDAPSYLLAIEGPAAFTTADASVTLTGDGFLPPGSTCPGDCAGLMPPPVFGRLGSYELGWLNVASGERGSMTLSWICNCGGSAPYWITTVPLVAGPNKIEVTMRAGGFEQRDGIVVTRE